jgi:hypothetical protein
MLEIVHPQSFGFNKKQTRLTHVTKFYRALLLSKSELVIGSPYRLSKPL